MPINYKFQKKTNLILKNISLVKIQGASNVAFATQDAFVHELNNLDKLKKESLEMYFLALCSAFWNTRPTEPAMKHFLVNFYVEFQSLLEANKTPKEIKPGLLKFISNYAIRQKKAISDIAKLFAKTRTKKCVIFTHCHSSIVEAAIKELHKKNCAEFVVNTETRPLFQGRITAKNLAAAGITVHHIVDSSAYAYGKLLQQQGKTIIFLTGADVITNRGDLINKIGTSQISLALNSLGIKHYVLTTSNKIDPVAKLWKLSEVEIRNPKEVWSPTAKKIVVKNFAFDITDARFVSYIVTEQGITKTKFLIIDNKLEPKQKLLWLKLEKMRNVGGLL